MTASLHASRVRAHLLRSVAVDRVPGRLWRWTASGLVAGEADVVGDVIAVPTEDVALKTVALPLPSHRQRLEALPFAIEDMIADSLEAVHLALGADTEPQHYLVGVVRHDIMRQWMGAAAEAGIDRATLVPDALLLPVPPAGAWRVHGDGVRVLVREPGGGGFAMPLADLPKAWVIAGSPLCLVSGQPFPTDLAIDATPAPLDDHSERVPPLNLAQGRYAFRRRLRVSTVGRRLIIVLAVGAAAHAAIAVADTLVLQRIAQQRAEETRVLASSLIPGLAPDADLIGTVASRLPAASSRSTDGFVDLLDRISAALAPTGGVALDAMTYDAAGQTMSLAVPIGSEKHLAAALTSGGLRVVIVPGRLAVRRPA